jgi:hypothetical protein
MNEVADIHEIWYKRYAMDVGGWKQQEDKENGKMRRFIICVYHTGEIRNAQNIFVRKSDRKRSPGRP